MQSSRKRPTYNEVVNYLENEQPKVKHPDRRATFLRNSPYLSQFDGDSWIDLDEQEQDINKEKLKQITLKDVGASQGETHQLLSARTKRYSIASETPSEGYDSAVIDFLSDIEHDQTEREETRRGVLSRGRDMISRMLGRTEEQIVRPEFLPQEQKIPLLEYSGTPFASASPSQGSLPPLEDISKLTPERKREIMTQMATNSKLQKYRTKRAAVDSIVDDIIDNAIVASRTGKSSSSSSQPSKAMPHGVNPVPLPTTATDEAWFSSKTVAQIKDELKKLGVSVKGESDWVQLLQSERRKKKNVNVRNQ